VGPTSTAENNYEDVVQLLHYLLNEVLGAFVHFLSIVEHEHKFAVLTQLLQLVEQFYFLGLEHQIGALGVLAPENLLSNLPESVEVPVNLQVWSDVVDVLHEVFILLLEVLQLGP